VSSHKVINPYFVKYNEVFNLSLNILKDEFANIGNSSSEISAFLFDISLLFEHHIRKLIKRRLTLLPKNIVEFWIPNGIKENKICPDIVIDYGDNKIGIYDVKYKHFQFQGKDQGVERNDRFQLTSYVALYLAKYEVIECGIIYPLKADEQHLQSLVNEQQLRIGGKEIPFHVKFYLVQNDLENQPGADKDFLNIMIDSQPRHFGL
jgi:5-methylcytosine-specific restriction endonuclease McrBC regulatory subunit McrC